MSTWVMGGQTTELATRQLYEVDEGFSLGGVIKWDTTTHDPDILGFCGVLDASWVFGSTDTDPPAPFPISWLENLHAVPYVTLEILDDVDNNRFSNVQEQWGFGTKFMVNPDGNGVITIEYNDGSVRRGDMQIGGMLKY
jgi:hypothetical protein